MHEVPLLLTWLDPERDHDINLPAYHSELAAGMDVAAAVSKPVVINPGEIKMLPSEASINSSTVLTL